MVFASPIFLLLFLPLTLAAYLLARGQAKNVVLLVASVVFYLWGEGRFIALLVASVLANWGFGRAIASSEVPRVRRRWLVAAGGAVAAPALASSVKAKTRKLAFMALSSR